MIVAAIGLSMVRPAALAQRRATTSESKTVDGNAVLSSRGLTRMGNLYLLKAEIDAKDSIKKGADALQRMRDQAKTLSQTVVQTQERLANMDEELKSLQQRRDSLQTQKQNLANYLLDTDRDDNYKASIRIQMQQLDNQMRTGQDSIDRLSHSITLAQSQLHDKQASLHEIETAYKSEESMYEQNFSGVKAEYKPLMRDPQVIEALKQLNRSARPWIMIGPSWDYDKNVGSLAQLILKDAGLDSYNVTVTKRVGRRSTKVNVQKFKLGTRENEIRTIGYKAMLVESKLTGPAGTANRRTMSEAIAQLKPRIAEVRTAYTELSKDPLIKSAIEQVGPGSAIEPTDSFKNYEKRVPDWEKKLSASG